MKKLKPPRDYRPPEDDDDLLAECDVSMFRASGPGGQHKNRTLTAVRLSHRPSGIVVIGRRRRSRMRNMDDALTRLRDRIAAWTHRPKPRRPTKPSKASRRKRMDDKKKRGQIKSGRRPVRPDDDG